MGLQPSYMAIKKAEVSGEKSLLLYVARDELSCIIFWDLKDSYACLPHDSLLLTAVK